jgi:hypothetical protein
MPSQKASAILADSMKNEYQFRGPNAKRAYEERAMEVRKMIYTREDLDNIVPFPQLELIARYKHIDGYEHWKREDREQVIRLILLFQHFQQGSAIPILSYEDLKQFPIYMLKVIGFIRNINGYKHWKLAEKAIEKIMTDQGNRNEITDLTQLKMTELKEIGKNLGIKGAYKWKKENRDEAIRLIRQVQESTGIDIARRPSNSTKIYSSDELRQKQMKDLKKIGQQLNIKGRAEWRANQKSRIINDILRAQAEKQGDKKVADEIGKVMITIKLDARLLRQMHMDILKGIADGYDILYDDGSRDAPQLKNKIIRLITNAARTTQDECDDKLNEQKAQFDNHLEQYEEKITERAYEEVNTLQTELKSTRDYYEGKIAELNDEIRILKGSVESLVSEKVDKSLSTDPVERDDFWIPSPPPEIFLEEKDIAIQPFESPTGYLPHTEHPPLPIQESPIEPLFDQSGTPVIQSPIDIGGVGGDIAELQPLISPAVGDRYQMNRPEPQKTYSSMDDLPNVNDLFANEDKDKDIITGVRKCLGLDDV